jgi:uncharacterized LabA/DUF88 family protein
MSEYLFVDGAYLRETLEALAVRYFRGVPVELDYEALFSGFEKIFYFDCDPPKRKNEPDQDWAAREGSARATFKVLRALPGCHVILGQTKEQRQKGVDVQLAAQALTHVFRNNTRRLTLLTGDLDFKPLVDALVLEGAYVTLFFQPRTTAQELIDAADAKKVMWPHVVFNAATPSFRKANSLPNVIETTRDPTLEWDEDLCTGWIPVWEGKCSTGKAVVCQPAGPDSDVRRLICKMPEKQGYYWFMTGSTRTEELLKLLAEDI